MRVKSGDFIPVVHLVALGDRDIFIAPQRKVRVGHRMVGPDKFGSGVPLRDGELALGTEIRLDVVPFLPVDPDTLGFSTMVDAPAGPTTGER